MRAHMKHMEWDDYLPILELEYNNSQHATHEMSPFMVNYGRVPLIPNTADLQWDTDTPLVDEIFKKINEAQTKVLERLRENCDKILLKQTEKPLRRKVEFDEGDQVWLLTKNFKVPTFAHKKLQPRWVGLYQVLKKGPNNIYKLKFRI